MKKMFVVILLACVSCSSIKIKEVDQEDGFLISNYKTFNFFEVEASGDGLSEDYKANLELLKKTMAKHLQAKGLTSTTQSPDLLINIGIVVSKEVQTRETSFANPGDRARYSYMGARNYSWHAEEVVVDTYKQGSVSVHLVDRGSNKLVWKGTAESVVPEKEKNVPALIETGMEKLFARLK